MAILSSAHVERKEEHLFNRNCTGRISFYRSPKCIKTSTENGIFKLFGYAIFSEESTINTVK